MATVMARHKAVLTHRCSCGKLRDPVEKKAFSRHWLACLRCLGTIKQLS
jgi:hypothetical protein